MRGGGIIIPTTNSWVGHCGFRWECYPMSYTLCYLSAVHAVQRQRLCLLRLSVTSRYCVESAGRIAAETSFHLSYTLCYFWGNLGRPIAENKGYFIQDSRLVGVHSEWTTPKLNWTDQKQVDAVTRSVIGHVRQRHEVDWLQFVKCVKFSLVYCWIIG